MINWYILSNVKWHTEAEITTQLLQDLRKSMRAYKIPDIWNSLKPFDILWVNDWCWIAIEVKVIKKKKYTIWIDDFDWLLEPHQIINLKEFKQNGWLTYLAWFYPDLKKIFIFLYM